MNPMLLAMMLQRGANAQPAASQPMGVAPQAIPPNVAPIQQQQPRAPGILGALMAAHQRATMQQGRV